jgi:hypothetical protein
MTESHPQTVLREFSNSIQDFCNRHENYAVAFSSQESRQTSLICLLQSLDIVPDHFQHCFGNALDPRLIQILHHIAEVCGHDLPERPVAFFTCR